MENYEYQQNTGSTESVPAKQSDGFGIASLVCSIFSLCCCGGGLISVLAVIFAYVSRGKTSGQMSGVAKAGLIIGIVGIVTWVLALIANIIVYAIYGVSIFAMNDVAYYY